MAYEGYSLINIAREGKIVSATVDNRRSTSSHLSCTLNWRDWRMSLKRMPTRWCSFSRAPTRTSSWPHFDVSAILHFPTDKPATRADSDNNTYHAMCERFRTMDKVTIAQIEGRVGGGGSEISMSFDMRFGVIGKTIINQMEVPIGILPGGTGTQRMPRLIGRHRAIEVIIGGIDLDAETAERWGYLNRALPADKIDDFVGALARRIASFPAPAVRLAKQSINSATKPLDEGLRDESYLFQSLLREESAQKNMTRFLEIGGQTREGELRVADLSAEVARG